MHQLIPRLLMTGTLSLAAATAASAHAKLVRSSPAAGSTVATTPSDIQLELSEPVEASLSSIAMIGPDGTRTPLALPALAPDSANRLVAPIMRRLAPGT